MIPPQVYIIAAQAIIAFIVSRQNIARQAIEEQLVMPYFGSWDKFQQALTQYCPSQYVPNPNAPGVTDDIKQIIASWPCEGADLWIEITQQVGRRDLAHAKAVMERTAAYLQTQADLGAFVEREGCLNDLSDAGAIVRCLARARDAMRAAQPGSTIGGIVNKPIAGIPVWMWIAIVAVVVAIFYWKK